MSAILKNENQYDIFDNNKTADIVLFPLTTKLNTCKINNKRYLGNKYKLLGFIRNIVDRECSDINTVADIFAGTGAVSSAFIDKTLITNDILYSNYVCHLAWFGNQKYSQNKVKKIILFYNNINPSKENYMSDNFSNTFFSYENCKKIGFIREDIESRFNSKEINERESYFNYLSALCNG